MFDFGGQQSTSGFNFSFGQQPSSSTGFNFGQQQQPSSSSSSGTGFSFGQQQQPSSSIGFSFGQQQQQDTTTARSLTGTTITDVDYSKITQKTLFTQLPQSIKDQLANFEKQKKDARHMAAEAINKEQNEIEFQRLKRLIDRLNRKLSALRYDIEQERAIFKSLEDKVSKEIGWMEKAQANFIKLQSPYHYTDSNYTSDYFDELAKELEERMGVLWTQIEDIANTLSNIEATQYPAGKVLQETLRALQESFLVSATRISSLHEQVNNLRDAYLRSKGLPKNFFDEPASKSTYNHGFYSTTIQAGNVNLPGLIPISQQQSAQPQIVQPSFAQGNSFFNTPTSMVAPTSTSIGGSSSFNIPSASSTFSPGNIKF
jgi:hypothetical protein